MKGHKEHSLEHIHRYISETEVEHYGCNAKKTDVEKHGIRAVGDQYGCAEAGEVVIITTEKFVEVLGRKPPDDPALISLMSEQLLRNIS